VRSVGYRKYRAVQSSAFGLSGRKSVAVIRAAGAITGGSGGTGSSITAGDVIRQLRSLKKNKGVAAVVLRVDSPGGDALASDLMWREIQELAKVRTGLSGLVCVCVGGGVGLQPCCCGRDLWPEPGCPPSSPFPCRPSPSSLPCPTWRPREVRRAPRPSAPRPAGLAAGAPASPRPTRPRTSPSPLPLSHPLPPPPNPQATTWPWRAAAWWPSPSPSPAPSASSPASSTWRSFTSGSAMPRRTLAGGGRGVCVFAFLGGTHAGPRACAARGCRPGRLPGCPVRVASIAPRP
jgi:hypothetical protein